GALYVAGARIPATNSLSVAGGNIYYSFTLPEPSQSAWQGLATSARVEFLTALLAQTKSSWPGKAIHISLVPILAASTPVLARAQSIFAMADSYGNGIADSVTVR